MAKTIMVSNNLSGTYDYQLAHVKFYGTDGNPSAVENGAAVILDGAINNEVYKAVAPKDGYESGVYIIGGDVMDKRNYEPKKLSEMENASGEIVRAYYANPTGTFSITIDGFTSDSRSKAARGKYVTLTPNDTKFTVADSEPTDVDFFGIIEDDSLKIEGLTLYKIRVITNQFIPRL